MNNSALFATFGSKVFAALHESFPIPLTLPKKEIIASVESHDEFWELERKVSIVTGMREIMEMTDQMTTELKDKAEKSELELTAQLKDKEQRLRHVGLVFDGTVDFLFQEGFIRSSEEGMCQLTLKGLTHLNRRYSQEGITESTSLIEKLLDALRPEKFVGSVTTGTLASLIAKVFGG